MTEDNYDKEDLNPAEGDVLLGPEVLVPVLRVLPQVSETFLQLGFVLRDVIHNWPEVGERVRWPNPVMSGAGVWSGRSLQVQKKQLNVGSVSDDLLLLRGFKRFKTRTFAALSFWGACSELHSRPSAAHNRCGGSGERGAKRLRSAHLKQAAAGLQAILK